MKNGFSLQLFVGRQSYLTQLGVRGKSIIYINRSHSSCSVVLLSDRVTVLITSSVSRFGESLPLWHSFKSLEQNVDGLFSIWQNLIFLCQNNMILGKFSLSQLVTYFKIIQPSGHTDHYYLLIPINRFFLKEFHTRKYLVSFLYLFQAIFHTQADLRLPTNLCLIVGSSYLDL